MELTTMALMMALMVFQTGSFIIAAARYFRRHWLAILGVLAYWGAHALLFLGALSDHASYQDGVGWVVLALYSPSILSLLALAISRRARGLVDGMSLQWLIASVEGPARIIVGTTFLLWWAAGALPGAFAWVAGPGDILAGVFAFLAMWVLRPLARQADLKGRHFSALELERRWQARGMIPHDARWRINLAIALVLFGVLDFLAAPAASGLAIALGTPPEAMGQLPLAIVPRFLVPQVLLLEVFALRQLFVLRSRLDG